MGSPQADTLNSDSSGVVTSGNYGNAGDGVSRWFQWMRKADGADAALGATGDSAQTNPAGSGTAIAVLKGILSRMGGGIPGSLSTGGGMRVGVLDPLPAGNNNIGDVDVASLPALPAGGNTVGNVGKMPRKSAVQNIKTAGVISADGNSSDLDTSAYMTAVFIVNVTAVTGANFDLYWQTKMGSLYGDVVKLNSAAITATGTYCYTLTVPMGSMGRMRWGLTSGTSWNMTVDMIMEA